MLFSPIVTAIETMLSTAETTKDLIAAYRQFTLPEPGTWVTPLCVIAPDIDVSPGLAGYAPTVLRNDIVSITIHFLERSYDVDATHKILVTALDTLQHNACEVLKADSTLLGTVTNCKRTRIQLQRYNEEYFEYVLNLEINTLLE